MPVSKIISMPNLAAYRAINAAVTAAGARLVAVSKTHPVSAIRELYDLGHRDFGENRVPELVEKHNALPKDIRWHFIGHLQRNKVRDVVPFVHLIHAVDSYRLLVEIDKRAETVGRRVSVLLQYHIAQEASKYGLEADTAGELLDKLATTPLPHVRVAGVMGMATYTDDEAQVGREFATLANTFAELRGGAFRDEDAFREISMGMSGDYPLALAHGSTLVRVGSALFGGRQ